MVWSLAGEMPAEHGREEWLNAPGRVVWLLWCCVEPPTSRAPFSVSVSLTVCVCVCVRARACCGCAMQHTHLTVSFSLCGAAHFSKGVDTEDALGKAKLG